MSGAEAMNRSRGFEHVSSGRGALRTRRSGTVRSRGGYGRENAGMSSEKTGENPVRRKPEVS